MRYRLGIETTTGAHWFAWVLDLPGCYSVGNTRAAAISNAGAAIAAYHQWIARHRNETPFDDPYMDIHVTEVFQTTEPVPGVETRAFFEEDRMPLGEEEVASALGLLGFTRADLVALCTRTKSSPLPEPIHEMLRQVAHEEWKYLDHLGVAFPEADLPGDPLEALEKTHAYAQEALTARANDRRVVTKDGELWSLRKLIRRTLWLERDRAQQITKLVSQ